MLMPKRTKYRRVQRGRMKGAASRGNKIAYGEFGIQAMEPGWITGNQIEAARVAMTRYTKRGGQVWIKIFPDKPVSKLSLIHIFVADVHLSSLFNLEFLQVLLEGSACLLQVTCFRL